jgi:hypothetical protein
MPRDCDYWSRGDVGSMIMAYGFKTGGRSPRFSKEEIVEIYHDYLLGNSLLV